MAPTTMQSVLVATHNLMHGLRLPALIPHYVALRDERRAGPALPRRRTGFLDSRETTLPERANRGGARPRLPRRARRRLPRPRLRPRRAHADLRRRRRSCPLPLLAALNPFERLYIVGGKTKQKYACCSPSSARGPAARRSRRPASTWTPRAATRTGRTQVEAIAAALRERNLHQAFVACGDTNAFALAPPARGAAAAARPAGGVRRGRSGDPAHPLLRPPERRQVPARDRRFARQARHRPGRLATTSLCTNLAARRTRPGRHARLRPRSGLGAHRSRRLGLTTIDSRARETSFRCHDRSAEVRRSGGVRALPRRGAAPARQDPADPVGELRLEARCSRRPARCSRTSTARAIRASATTRASSTSTRSSSSRIDRAKALFGAEHANVQPYSGSPANLAVYFAFLQARRHRDGHGAARRAAT